FNRHLLPPLSLHPPSEQFPWIFPGISSHVLPPPRSCAPTTCQLRLLHVTFLHYDHHYQQSPIVHSSLPVLPGRGHSPTTPVRGPPLLFPRRPDSGRRRCWLRLLHRFLPPT